MGLLVQCHALFEQLGVGLQGTGQAAQCIAVLEGDHFVLVLAQAWQHQLGAGAGKEVQQRHQGRQVVAPHAALDIRSQFAKPFVQALHPDADFIVAVEPVERIGHTGQIARGLVAAVAMFLGVVPQTLGVCHGLRVVVHAHGAPDQAVVVFGKGAAAQAFVVQFGRLVVAPHEAVFDGQVVAQHGVHVQVGIVVAALAGGPEMLEAAQAFFVIAHDQRLAGGLCGHFLLAAHQRGQVVGIVQHHTGGVTPVCAFC